MSKIKLPLGESLSRSFYFAFNHWDAFLKITLLWGLFITGLDALQGFPSLADTENNVGQLYLWGMFIGGIPITISYIIYVIERNEYKGFLSLRLGKKDLQYLWAVLKLIFAGLLIGALFGTVVNNFFQLLNIEMEMALRLFLSFLVLFMVGLLLAPYTLVFPAIALDNKEIDFQKSHQLTRGNALAILGGLIALSLPFVFINLLVSSLYMALGTENILINLFFSFIQIELSLFYHALKASFMAHIYQYFIYFYKKSEEKEEVA